MGTHSKPGFTIIETMLVLAITGVLIAGLLIGIGTSIGVQRYGDAVSSFKALLQDQYTKVSNVSNDRDASWTCDASATPAQGSGGIAPGQSNCVLLGRYISVVDGDISLATVVGYENATGISSSDIQTVKDNYTLGLSQSSIDKKTLEWGTKIAWPQPRTPSPRSIAILILRSPVSGTTYTFTSDSVAPVEAVASPTLKAMLVETVASFPGQGQRTICIDPDGAPVPEKFAIYMAQAASGPGSIETRTTTTNAAAGGGTTQC